MVKIKASKPIEEIKKGDHVKVDGKKYEVDAHYVMIDHGKSKEVVVELFDPKADKDYQLRYFSNQPHDSISFYELKDIVYEKIDVEKVEW